MVMYLTQPFKWKFQLSYIQLKFFILLFLPLLTTNNSFAQDPDPNPVGEVLPPPPGVAEIEKYGSVPTTLYTGLPNVSIPIYTITSKSISVPISLSYHAQGVKVNDVSGPVGLGWSLNAGGHLAKYVNGNADEPTSTYNSGFSSTTEITNYLALYPPQTSQYEEAPVTDVIGEEIFCGVRDNDVDIYSFSMPSGSGKFFYDNNDQIRFMPIQNYDVVYNDTYLGKNVKFTMRDGNGITYHFNDTEKQKSLYGSPDITCPVPEDQGVSEVYKLNRIHSIDGGLVEFFYDTINYTYLTDRNEFKVNNDGTVTYDFGDSYSWSGVDLFQGLRVRRIETKEGYAVDFEYNNGISYASSHGPGKLTGVTISFKGNVFKTFDLNYSSFTSGSSNVPAPIPTTNYSGRSKLLSVEESGKGVTSFTYNSTPLPPRFSYAQDYWGYYNGANTNTTLLPDKALEGDVFNVSFATGNRAANPNFMGAGTLNKITYPTGGETSFTFESNRRVDPSAGANGCVTTFVTKSSLFESQAISSNCADEVNDSFNLLIPQGSIGVKVYYNSNYTGTSHIDCVHNQGMNRAIVQYGSNSFAIQNQSGFTDLGDFNGAINISTAVNGTNAQSELIWRTISVVWQEPVTTCPDGSNPVMQYLGGLRLRSQVDIAGPGTEPVKRTYTYENEIYKLPKFNSNKVGFTVDGACYFEANSPVLTLSSSSVTQSNTLFGGGIAYNKVTEYLGEIPGCYTNEELQLVCPTSNGKIEYYYSHQLDGVVTDPVLGFGVLTDYSHRRGELKERKEYLYNGSDFLLKSKTVNSFETADSFTYYGLKAFRVRSERTNGDECQSLVGGGHIWFPQYTYLDYQHISEWIRLESTSTTEYFYSHDYIQEGSKVTSVSYEYNMDNQLPNEVVTTYPESSQRINNFYAFTEANGRVTSSDTYVNETSNSFPNTLVQRVEYDYGSLSGTSPLLYNLTGYRVLKGAETLKDVSVEYDSEGRTLKVEDNISEIPVSYNYEETDYSNIPTIYPSAKCTNCESFRYRNFEVDVLGPPQAQVSILDSNAKSGKYVGDLSKGSVSISAPANYIIEYWHKSALNGQWSRSTNATYSNGTFQISGSGYVDDIKVYPPGGQVTSHTYEPGLGFTSMTDTNGKVIYYQYDEHGRLVRELDDDKNVLKEYQYNIVNFN